MRSALLNVAVIGQLLWLMSGITFAFKGVMRSEINTATHYGPVDVLAGLVLLLLGGAGLVGVIRAMLEEKQ